MVKTKSDFVCTFKTFSTMRFVFGIFFVCSNQSEILCIPFPLLTPLTSFLFFLVKKNLLKSPLSPFKKYHTHLSVVSFIMAPLFSHLSLSHHLFFFFPDNCVTFFFLTFVSKYHIIFLRIIFLRILSLNILRNGLVTLYYS